MQPGVASQVRTTPKSPAASVVNQHDFATVYESDRNRMVRALSISLRDDALANEAIDEAFTRALHRWTVVGSLEEPQAWIYRTAHNWATSRFRRRKRDRQYASKVARPEATEDSPPDPALAKAIQELPADQRDVLVMRYYLDWTIAASAEALNVSPGTVKSRTSRALNELNRILGEN